MTTLKDIEERVSLLERLIVDLADLNKLGEKLLEPLRRRIDRVQVQTNEINSYPKSSSRRKRHRAVTSKFRVSTYNFNDDQVQLSSPLNNTDTTVVQSSPDTLSMTSGIIKQETMIVRDNFDTEEDNSFYTNFETVQQFCQDDDEEQGQSPQSDDNFEPSEMSEEDVSSNEDDECFGINPSSSSRNKSRAKKKQCKTSPTNNTNKKKNNKLRCNTNTNTTDSETGKIDMDCRVSSSPPPDHDQEIQTNTEGLRVFPSKRKFSAIYKEFYYVYHSPGNGIQVMRCSKHRSGCHGRLHLSMNYKSVISEDSSSHNHPNNESLGKAAYTRWKLRDSAKRCTASTSSIVADVLENLNEDSRTAFPKLKSLRRYVQRTRLLAKRQEAESDFSLEKPIELSTSPLTDAHFLTPIYPGPLLFQTSDIQTADGRSYDQSS